MPDQTPTSPQPGPGDPRWRYRVSAYYAPDVIPPKVAGELAEQRLASDSPTSDEAVEALVGRTDIGRIVVEERQYTDVTTGVDPGWKVARAWQLNDDGHGWALA